eukprot:jgi/Chlat1/8358/Chrsp80S07793
MVKGAGKRGSASKLWMKLSCAPKLADGAKAELWGDDEGLQGSWYPVVVRGQKKKNNRLVWNIQHLELTDDHGQSLIEDISVDQGRVRPPYPERATIQPLDQYKYGDWVECAYQDGWWEGFICKHDGEEITVRFPETGDNLLYTKANYIRPGLEYVQGDVWQSKPPVLQELLQAVRAELDKSSFTAPRGDGWVEEAAPAVPAVPVQTAPPLKRPSERSDGIKAMTGGPVVEAPPAKRPTPAAQKESRSDSARAVSPVKWPDALGSPPLPAAGAGSLDAPVDLASDDDADFPANAEQVTLVIDRCLSGDVTNMTSAQGKSTFAAFPVQFMQNLTGSVKQTSQGRDINNHVDAEDTAQGARNRRKGMPKRTSGTGIQAAPAIENEHPNPSKQADKHAAPSTAPIVVEEQGVRRQQEVPAKPGSPPGFAQNAMAGSGPRPSPTQQLPSAPFAKDNKQTTLTALTAAPRATALDVQPGAPTSVQLPIPSSSTPAAQTQQANNASASHASEELIRQFSLQLSGLVTTLGKAVEVLSTEQREASKRVQLQLMHPMHTIAACHIWNLTTARLLKADLSRWDKAIPKRDTLFDDIVIGAIVLSKDHNQLAQVQAVGNARLGRELICADGQRLLLGMGMISDEPLTAEHVNQLQSRIADGAHRPLDLVTMQKSLVKRHERQSFELNEDIAKVQIKHDTAVRAQDYSTEAQMRDQLSRLMQARMTRDKAKKAIPLVDVRELYQPHQPPPWMGTQAPS